MKAFFSKKTNCVCHMSEWTCLNKIDQQHYLIIPNHVRFIFQMVHLKLSMFQCPPFFFNLSIVKSLKCKRLLWLSAFTWLMKLGPTELEQTSLFPLAVWGVKQWGANSTGKWNNHQKQDILCHEHHETNHHPNQKERWNSPKEFFLVLLIFD